MEGFVLREGYYQAVQEPYTTPPISLTDPSNMFFLQNAVTNNLNQFQTQYSRYLRCQDPNTYSGVSPACDVDGTDSFGNLNTAYRNLLESIQDLSHSYVTQSNVDAKTPDQYNAAAAQLPLDYASVVKLRKQLDEQLQLLYNGMGKGPDTSVHMLESAMFANTIWIILASCLIYYIFIEL